MPSGLTINVSAVASTLANPAQSANTTQKSGAQDPPSAAQVAVASQAASEAAIVHQGRRADEKTPVQVPKRVEPGYGNTKKKKKSSKSAPEEEREQEADQGAPNLDLKA